MKQPMLAVKADLKKQKYPVIVSPKLDGIRCVIKDGMALSRTMKPIPNEYVQDQLGKPELNGLDGELIIGEPNIDGVYKRSHSGVMTRAGEPDFYFHVFDRWNIPNIPFSERLQSIADRILEPLHPLLISVPHYIVKEEKTLLRLEEHFLDYGFEGLMLRHCDGPYKQGRSTLKEGWLLKLKRYLDAEARIVGFEELMRNDNEAKIGNTGHQERSSHKENLTPMGTLGALLVEDCKTGIDFKIGTGFSEDDRRRIWEHRENLLGHLVKYKYFPIGVDKRPRHPVFLGFRDKEDM